MTAIAYRDGIMACDSCYNDKGTIDSLGRKIEKLKHGALLGLSGDNDCRELVAALQNITSPAHLPTRKQLFDIRLECDALLVFRNRRIFRVATTAKLPEGIGEDDDVGIWEVLTRPYAAVGSGADYCLGAMAQGANARRAVAIACGLNINCRLPVHTAELKANGKA